MDDGNSAGAGYSTGKANQSSAHENVHFVDGDSPWFYDIKHEADETTRLAGFQDAQLGDFLSRPVKIQEYQWTPGGTRLFEPFNPWSDFFGNADVKEKINRFRNLRCNLRMKVLVNGNSFYYGRALLSYNPFLTNDSVTRNRAFFEQDLVQASQKPHILLDPTASQGGEMLLPFIWNENYLDITSAGWEDDMGSCIIHDFDILRHANGGTDPITVSVFVWAENLVLSVPTTFAAQSGKGDLPLDKFGFPIPYQEQAASKGGKKKPKKASNQSTNDEFKSNGMISMPASAVAAAADALSAIPMLMPYAKATSMVATKIGQVARIFGYSRPAVLEDCKPFVPRYAGNICNSDAPETLVKLSLDSKNELSIDSRIMGLGGEDELTINAIAQRPSFWRQFDWPEAATTDTLLTSIRVTPSYIQTLNIPNGIELHPTALAFACQPFDCWQGTIKFRFNVVASEYHRGRLRLVYNPIANSPGAVPFNQVYSTIIDIAEDRDFEYEVRWADVRAWAQVLALNAGLLHSDSNPIVGGLDSDNGTLTVYVLNELATPAITDADVKIQVWVSAGDDFALSVPTADNLASLSYFEPQTAIAPARDVYVVQSEMAPERMVTSLDKSNAPLCSTEIPSFAPGYEIKDDHQYLVYQGERIVSFREMLRRYFYHYSYYPGETGTGVRLVTNSITDFPAYRGWDPNGIDSGATSPTTDAPYTYCNMTLLNYLTPAFACRRGGLRHKILHTDVGAPKEFGNMTVSRYGISGSTNSVGFASIDDAVPGDRRRAFLSSSVAFTGGSHVTPISQNPILEFETPFYTIGQRFVPARDLNYWAGFHSAFAVTTEIGDDNSGYDVRLDRYISVAEDFALAMFVGAPVMFEYSNPDAV